MSRPSKTPRFQVGQMNDSQSSGRRGSPEVTTDRQNDHRQQRVEHWTHQHKGPNHLNRLSDGNPVQHAVNCSDDIFTHDGTNDEIKLSNDSPTAADKDSHQGCHHCHHTDDQPRDALVEAKVREHVAVRSVRTVPVTIERKPFIARPDSKLRHAGNDASCAVFFASPTFPGTARACVAATEDKPYGAIHTDWVRNHSHQTVLQQHCDFIDTDDDGIIWPQDTLWGFHKLGFGIMLSVVAVFVIRSGFSYPTLPTWLPDPFLRIYIANIHKDKYGSDSGTYDHEGRFVPQKFEDMFEKYAGGRGYMTIWDVIIMMKGQRCIGDPVGRAGALFKWLTTYFMLWPEDGRMMKEDIRGVYDGRVFGRMAARHASDKAYGYG